MNKLTLLLNNGKHAVYLDKFIRTKYECKMYVKNIAIYWKFKNVLKGANDTITADSTTVTFEEYWTFNMISDKLNPCLQNLRSLPTIPVYRKDSKNMTKAVDLLPDKFRTRFDKYPDVSQVDEGNEFYNVGIRNLLKSHNINYFSTKADKKAAIVERFNRTLKNVMWKYFYSKGTHNWITC